MERLQQQALRAGMRMNSQGRAIAFHSENLEAPLQHGAAQLGYRLLNYRIELFGTAYGSRSSERANPGTACVAT